MDIHARVGDEIVVDSNELGHPPRRGEVLEVLGKDRVLARLDAGAQMASRAAAT